MASDFFPNSLTSLKRRSILTSCLLYPACNELFSSWPQAPGITTQTQNILRNSLAIELEHFGLYLGHRVRFISCIANNPLIQIHTLPRGWLPLRRHQVSVLLTSSPPRDSPLIVLYPSLPLAPLVSLHGITSFPLPKHSPCASL